MTTRPEHPIASHSGRAVLMAPQAIVKGALECAEHVSCLVMTRTRVTAPTIDMLRQDHMRSVLRRNRLVTRFVEDSGRTLELARWEARDDRHVVAVLSGGSAPSAVNRLLESERMHLEGTSAMVVIAEDAVDGTSLRPRFSEYAMPVIEVTSVTHLRAAVEQGLRLSRGGGVPAVVLVDTSIMHSASTQDLLPNHAGDGVPAGPPRQRGPRWDEVGGPLRIARRLELNQARSMPSPGETIGLGFITVGVADRALRRLESILKVEGRLPTLNLALVNPIDTAAIDRVLTRCRDVVVLECSGAAIEHRIRRRADMLRKDGQSPAMVWGSRLPTETTGDHGRDALHPSVLARRLAPLLDEVLPASNLTGRLEPAPPPLPVDPARAPVGPRGLREELTRIVGEAIAEPEDDADEDEVPAESLRWLVDGHSHGLAEGRRVVVETWSERRFRREGEAAVHQAATDGGAWLIIVGCGAAPAGQEIERLAKGEVPQQGVSALRVERRRLDAMGDIRRVIRESAHWMGLTVLVVEDDAPSRFDIDRLERMHDDIDRVGYQKVQRVVWPAEHACIIRQPAGQARSALREVQEVAAARASLAAQTLPARWPPRLGGRIRPLVEQIEVFRTRPPQRRDSGVDRPAQPEVIHGDQPIWSVHLAGLRGTGTGMLGEVLIEAGVVMGYHVECQVSPGARGPGRRAWAQLVFTRPRDAQERESVPPSIPWGEADLLLGYDRMTTLESVSPDGPLRVGSRQRTSIVANVGLFEDELDRPEDARSEAIAIEQYLQQVGVSGRVLPADVTAVCRFRFHNERLADLVLLGIAWQQGAIPTTLDAMHTALERVEGARLVEAFEFGRAASLDPQQRLRAVQERPVEPPVRSVRRQRLMMARGRFAGTDRADRFRQLAERALSEVPGLLETSRGREAHRDFMVALRRCVTWGGFEFAERFADRIIELYRADRADTGRALTRAAVLPLAEAILHRDAIYLASMAVSAEHRRQTRQRLNIRPGRGDTVNTRYLVRFELTFIRWRVHVDVRTSDWVAQALSTLRRVMPHRLRGRRREHRVRDEVVELVMQAASAPPEEYLSFQRKLEHLHTMALDGGLRRIDVDALRRLLDGLDQGAFADS